MAADFSAAFAALRAILRKHAGGMLILADTPTNFSVNTQGIAPNSKPLWFGAVMLKKSAVTYHLMPLYYNPRLQAVVPGDLLKRKQGKTCFNFRKPDPALFEMIDALTGRAREAWQAAGFLEQGVIPPERFQAALRAAGEDPAAIAKKRIAVAKAAAKKRAATIKRKTSPK